MCVCVCVRARTFAGNYNVVPVKLNFCTLVMHSNVDSIMEYTSAVSFESLMAYSCRLYSKNFCLLPSTPVLSG